MEHKPRCLLSHPQAAGNLMRTDPVPAVGHHLHGCQPLVQADGVILEDGPHLHAELAPGMPGLALPDAPGREEGQVFGSAGRTNETLGPPGSEKCRIAGCIAS
jgi:hypothetical protein